MTQFEAEAVITALKKKTSESVSIILEKYSHDRDAVIHNKEVALNDIDDFIQQAHITLLDLKSELAQCNKQSDEWRKKSLKVLEASTNLKGYYKLISETKNYCREELRKLLLNKEEEIRAVRRNYMQERNSILSMVQRVKKEDNVNYWRHKYFAAVEELNKLKEGAA